MQELIGWAASVILLLTIFSQIHQQWKEQTARGVSYWLFVGQSTASALFVLYSSLIGNIIFAVTNVGICLAALLGLALTHRQKRAERHRDVSRR